jgi:hypothetical protein
MLQEEKQKTRSTVNMTKSTKESWKIASSGPRPSYASETPQTNLWSDPQRLRDYAGTAFTGPFFSSSKQTDLVVMRCIGGLHDAEKPFPKGGTISVADLPLTWYVYKNR